MDYTVIMAVRHQFGNEDLNIGVFAGEEAEFSFNCPGVEASGAAVLLFQGNRVSEEQTLEINDLIVSGGIPPGPVSSTFPVLSVSPGGQPFHSHNLNLFDLITTSGGWSGYVMLVSPNVLKVFNNRLRVASRGSTEFIIDNMVLFYKTEPELVEPVPPNPEDL